MLYPSLLWDNEKGEEKSPGVAENTLADLVLPLDFSMATRSIMRILCTPAEISFRGDMIWKIATEEGGAYTTLDEILAELYTKTETFERLLRRYDKAGKETCVLLFPVVVSSYLRLLVLWCTVPDTGRFGVVRAHMEKLLGDNTLLCLCEEIESYQKIRRDNITVQSEMFSQTVYPCDALTAEKQFHALFTEMGIPDALPAEKLAKEADEKTICAYALVYPHVRELAQSLQKRFSDTVFGDRFSIRSMVAYAGEIAFLREMARHTRRMLDAGYDMCLPALSVNREIRLYGMRDMALVKRNMRGADVVPNDVEMNAEEHFFLLGGANGGGKTTYLRALGLSILFALTGCPIAAKSGSIYPFRRFFTHFPANETFSDTGRFLEEENRVRVIRENAGPDSIALFNETFSGTYEKKAEEYSRALAVEMTENGVFGVYVTHIHALTGQSIPSLAAVIDPEDENKRTYKIQRVDRTDSSYARDILRKYALDWEGLAARLQSKGGDTHEPLQSAI